MQTFEERLENLLAIKDTLISDKKFNMKFKRWPLVTVCNRNLKEVENRIASVKFHARLAA